MTLDIDIPNKKLLKKKLLRIKDQIELKRHNNLSLIDISIWSWRELRHRKNMQIWDLLLFFVTFVSFDGLILVFTLFSVQ